MKSLLLCALALTRALAAAEYTTELTPANTRIEWTLGDVLHTVHGTFQLARGTLRFDPDSGSAAGEVVVNVVSGASGGGTRDKRMHKNILESALFPEAVFTPNRIEGQIALAGASHARLLGQLKLHGATHAITMEVSAKGARDRIDADLTFDVPYVDWGMRDPSTLFLKVNKTVQVVIHCTQLSLASSSR